MEVLKFGGSSVATPQALENVCKVINRHQGPSVVVVSALGGLTDKLLSSATSASQGNIKPAELTAMELERRHTEVIKELISDKFLQKQLQATTESSAQEFLSICRSLAVLREHTPRILDAVVARGEQLCADMLTGILQCQGHSAKKIDATELIWVDQQSEQMSWNLEKTKESAQKLILDQTSHINIFVVPGYLATDSQGKLVTLGRGGSDYSATIIARALNAKSVTLYKEVDGLLTADPKYVPSARVVTKLHYREAAELAYYGAKILHPRTIIPLVEAGIPLTIKNSFNPDFDGSTISSESDPSFPIKALTAMPNMSLITVEGKGMLGVPGISARTFSTLAHESISVSFISQASSEANLCFMVAEEDQELAVAVLKKAFHFEIQHQLIDNVTSKNNLAIVAVVGLGMQGVKGVAARSLNAVAQQDINLVAIAQGSSELNLSLVIDKSQVSEALRSLHQAFDLDQLQNIPPSNKKTVHIGLLGFGQISRTLLRQIVSQKEYFQNSLNLNLSIVFISDKSGGMLELEGFSLQQILSYTNQKSSGISISQMTEKCDSPFDFFKNRSNACSILVDCTAMDATPLFEQALESGIHVVSANKIPLAQGFQSFSKLIELTKNSNGRLKYEATVGAGLPILDTLKKMHESGDQIHQILGSLSGTLGYILSSMEDGLSFSEAVEKAYQEGYTEPHPRDDLSGVDIARKALILSSTIGLPFTQQDIQTDSLFPHNLDHADPKVFLKKLKELDPLYQQKCEHAHSKRCVLRYMAHISKEGITVGLKEMDENSPFARLTGTNNQIAITSNRYQENPLVVTGPGAGSEVTASGVLNDILSVAMEDLRR